MAHRFSSRLRSRFCGGHCNTQTSFCFSNLFTFFSSCLGSWWCSMVQNWTMLRRLAGGWGLVYRSFLLVLNVSNHWLSFYQLGACKLLASAVYSQFPPSSHCHDSIEVVLQQRPRANSILFYRGTKDFTIAESYDLSHWRVVVSGTLTSAIGMDCQAPIEVFPAVFHGRYIKFSAVSYLGYGYGLQYFSWSY